MEFDDYSDGVEDAVNAENLEDIAQEFSDAENIYDDMDFSDLEDVQEEPENLYEDLDLSDPKDIAQEKENLYVKQALLDQKNVLSDQKLEALSKSPLDRSWQEVELVDSLRNPGYEAQNSYPTDAFGQVLRDENGDLITCARNVAGSQRPDLIMEDAEGIHIREDKSYKDIDSLERNILEQTEKRQEGFGENVDVTYVVAPKFTVEEAEKLQNFCQELGVNMEFQLK